MYHDYQREPNTLILIWRMYWKHLYSTIYGKLQMNPNQDNRARLFFYFIPILIIQTTNQGMWNNWCQEWDGLYMYGFLFTFKATKEYSARTGTSLISFRSSRCIMEGFRLLERGVTQRNWRGLQRGIFPVIQGRIHWKFN